MGEAIKLRLQQPDLDKDEYLLQSADDGRYVVVPEDQSRWSRKFGPYALTDDFSEATRFRLSQCRPPRLPRDRLEIGQRVLYRVQRRLRCCGYYTDEQWVRGVVCARRCNEFGCEVRIEYDGMVTTDEDWPFEKDRRSGTTEWLPLTSYDIDFEERY